MMKNMTTGIRTDRTLKLSHLLIAFFMVMGTFVASYSAKAHSVAVFIEIGTIANGRDGQVRFHALTWHGFSGTSGSMRVNGTWYAFQHPSTTLSSGPPNQLSNYRLVASCSGWNSYNTWGYTYQSTGWISGINLCASMSFSMTGYYLEEPACNLSGSVDVSQPVIVSQPTYTSSTVCQNSAINLTVVASGINLKYQWQHSSDGISWLNVGTSSTSPNYSGTANNTAGSVGGPNSRYRCIVTSEGNCGVKTATSSSSSVLSVIALPQISSSPATTLTLCSGSSGSASVVATGSGLSYRWQLGGVDIPTNDPNTTSGSATSATLRFTAGGIYANNTSLRCRVSNSCGPSVFSGTLTLTVNPSTTVSSPSSATICENSGATFTVTAGSTQNPTYQWQVSRNGGVSFSNISDGVVAGVVTYTGTLSSTLTVSGATASLTNARYRCVVNGTCGSATSATPATLTINRFSAIAVEPTSQTACLSSPTTPAVFSVSATGSSLSYTWQSAGSITGTFSNVSNPAGITHATSPGGAQLTVTPANETYNGHVYRVLISGACGSTITSSTVTLTVATPAVVAPISNSTPSVCEAGTVSLSVSATGSNLSYRWQEFSGGTFTNVTASNYRGFTTNTLTILGAPTDFSGRAYRAVVTGTCGSAANSGTITLTVNANPSISVQPVNQNICLPNAATFSVTAAGFSLTYQWETSTDGGVTYSNVSSVAGVGTYTGSTTSSLSIGASGTLNQNRYRVKITGGCGNPIYSDAKILTVSSVPNITAQPLANTSICVFSSGTVSLTDAGLGNTYQWQVSTTRGGGTFTNTANTSTTTGISYAGVTTTKLTIGRVPVEQDGFLYRCIITPNIACGITTTTSGTVTLTVNTRPAITIQPVNANNNTFLQNNQFGSITTTTYVYKVTATGSYTTPSDDLVWYESRDGGQSWGSISNTVGGVLLGTTLYTVSTTGTSPVVSELRVRMVNSTDTTSDYARRLGYIYRCLLNGICENVTTNAVKVNPPPKVNRRQIQ